MNTRVMTDKVHDLQKQVSEKAQHVGQAADRYVHDNTWTSIAMAAIFGCVLGYLLAGRHD
ncbi:MAG TPA: DUF883 domain-containing protein [Verrucomicrobia bacterium]|nr:DUF883 domain-containing protein [Verrucomicrobiota bacterium]HOB33853.1 hypothetical protein [Verrucomicrobiota bacterium]